MAYAIQAGLDFLDRVLIRAKKSDFFPLFQISIVSQNRGIIPGVRRPSEYPG